MKISYNWLKTYLSLEISPEETAIILTDIGLEVEAIEKFESIQGGLKDIVIGKVISKVKHPDADKLSITTVDIGESDLKTIVCGAPNVEIGQTVVVAKVGAKLFPTKGEVIEIKKSKIRGILSEGMICAEDEIGLGNSHEGIMILPNELKVGTLASNYFDVENDFVFEIGLTPNRSDAMSHLGVARDLAAALLERKGLILNIKIPKVNEVNNVEEHLKITIEDSHLCPRYSGVVINNINIKESPDWLKNRLKAIGLRPINNIVDVTNFVLQETGQPLHAFDLNKINDTSIHVKTVSPQSFLTLDGTERKLNGTELMICDGEKPMCIAGVFGGLESGVSEVTQSVFLESAYFDAVSIRKTAKFHGLKTDSSFRFERGTDPNMVVYALKRATDLIIEIAGGQVDSKLYDIYPTPISDTQIELNLEKLIQFSGIHLTSEHVCNILKSLDIKIVSSIGNSITVSVPPLKADVKREADLYEEILRIIGFNNIPIPSKLNASMVNHQNPSKEKFKNHISDLLAANNFTETMGLSLSQSSLYPIDKNIVKVKNPLSNELDVLRNNLIFSALDTLSYNINRKQNNLKIFEFGKTYELNPIAIGSENKIQEDQMICLAITGEVNQESWHHKIQSQTFYHLKSAVDIVITRFGINHSQINVTEVQNDLFDYHINYELNHKLIAVIGKVNSGLCKRFNITQEVFCSQLNFDLLFKKASKQELTYKEVSKFPEVRRDLALLVDKAITYKHLNAIAIDTEKKYLTGVNLFDVYEGDKIAANKKSYALSFTLSNKEATLTDAQVDKVMEKLIKAFTEKSGAELRT